VSDGEQDKTLTLMRNLSENQKANNFLFTLMSQYDGMRLSSTINTHQLLPPQQA
jgi:hypothetical protein